MKISFLVGTHIEMIKHQVQKCLKKRATCLLIEKARLLEQKKSKNAEKGMSDSFTKYFIMGYLFNRYIHMNFYSSLSNNWNFYNLSVNHMGLVGINLRKWSSASCRYLYQVQF